MSYMDWLCEYCGNHNDELSKKCEKCGAPIPEKDKTTRFKEYHGNKGR